jgi:transcription antitermination protein NusB
VSTPAGGVRRRARGHALQLLYAVDLNPAGDLGETAAFGAEYEIELDDEAAGFAHRLVEIARTRAGEIDDLIQGVSKNWRIDRMARVDRNILRLATAELLAGDAPARVVINEAVELAKRFGTAESASFVNGVVDRIAHQLGVE